MSQPENNQTRMNLLLARYVAGTLPGPAKLIVDAHLEMSPRNRSMVSGLEALAGVYLEQEVPLPISHEKRRLEEIFVSQLAEVPVETTEMHNSDLPRSLSSLIDLPIADIPWRTKLPGFKEYSLGKADGCTMELFWIKPGRPIPKHTHNGIELTLILEGAYNDKTGRYARGDIAVNDETVDHRPVTEKDGPCIGLAVTDAPLRLTGSLGQRLSDIIFS